MNKQGSKPRQPISRVPALGDSIIAELCPPTLNSSLSPYPQYLKMWPYLETRGNWVKMRPSWWALIQSDWYHYWERKYDVDTHAQTKGHVRTQYALRREATSASWTLSLQNCETVKFCCLRSSVRGVLSWQLELTQSSYPSSHCLWTTSTLLSHDKNLQDTVFFSWFTATTLLKPTF